MLFISCNALSNFIASGSCYGRNAFKLRAQVGDGAYAL